ncbi:hydroquinone glucosyltransferase-like [Abrus precatorius]|uniref:Hydroquinone glucosyltransferase-like n=1 Tax=Abrus precatorius TaxID=3816 RepID=A0A8B8JWL6_ABRPR|nr:hydroquinone glucosyltransferase-like [Abrus precatorius]
MEEEQSHTNTKKELPHTVAMMPITGMGHLIPMIEFAKRLTRHHSLHVTFLIPTNAPPSKPQTTLFSPLPRAISHVFLPQVSLSDLPPNTKIETIISLTVLRSLPSLRHSLVAIHRVAALVIDFFCTDAIDVAGELHIPSYIFFPSPAMALSFDLYLPRLDQEVQCEFRDLPEPVHIPGCNSIHGKDLMDTIQNRNDDAYKFFLNHCKRFSLAKGIIENSFPELEPQVIKWLLKDEPGRPPIYPVGPLVNEDIAQTEEQCLCLKWLDEQPRDSVVFVCFGSVGTLSRAQMEELALGLEMSEQRFLWVVKCPKDYIADVDAHADPLDFLPKGFVERTKGRGLVVPYWAPQIQILSHGSTGGFVSHCGWNSILECVVNGVPLVAWPLYAEQKMNAVLVTQDVKVALRPKVYESGLVEREEIASVVKTLMEGEEGKKLLHRIKELKVAAAIALGENGSSTKRISELALKWKGETAACII